MTVGELKKKIANYDDDTPILFVSDESSDDEYERRAQRDREERFESIGVVIYVDCEIAL